MALGQWLVASACGRDLGPVAGGLWLVAMAGGNGHGLRKLPWLVAVALACGRGQGLRPMAGSWTVKLTFVGLLLLDHLLASGFWIKKQTFSPTRSTPDRSGELLNI